MNEEVFHAVGEALSKGEPAALVTIIRTEGSTPQRVGSKMIVFADGRTVGTIGGGCYENDAFWKARQAIKTGKSDVIRYELTDDIAEESGLICGGQMDVYVEPIEAAPHLYLVGGGHIAYHLAEQAVTVGFRIHVTDDREKYANRERFPNALEISVDSIPNWLKETEIPKNSYVVILTRGHRYDLDALRSLAKRELRYLGLIGSRAKVVRLYNELVSEGIEKDKLRHIYAPVGLAIGAVTPQEIAISILSELIAVKNGKLSNESTGSNSVSALRWTPESRELESIG